MSKISFIHIKPNSNKDNFNQLNELTLKLANSNNSSLIDEELENINDIFEDVIIEKSELDPITYINSFYSDNNNKNYDIMSYDISNDKYYLLIYNSLLNSTAYLSSLDDDKRKKEFNLVASNLIRYYDSSNAIFGDVFILSIDKSYYDLLLNLDRNRDIELLLNKYNKIYYDFKLYEFITSYINVNYVKLYAKPLNNTYIYPRDIIKALADKYELIENNIIKILYDNLELYVKVSNPLPNSYYQIMDNIPEYKTSDDFHITNITEEDILFLLGNK